MIIVWKKWTITFFVFIDLKFGFYKIALWLNTSLLDRVTFGFYWFYWWRSYHRLLLKD
jgi:hypothetical protein